MDLYLKILDYLSDFGIEQETDITKLFDNYLLTPTDVTDMFYNGERIDKILAFLYIMAQRDHITYNNLTESPVYSEEDKEQQQKKGKIRQYVWVKPIKIRAAITVTGLDFYHNQILKKATIKSYSNQKWVNTITWLISCVSIAIAVFFGLKSNSLSTQVEELQKKVYTIEKTAGNSIYYLPKVRDTAKKTSAKKN